MRFLLIFLLLSSISVSADDKQSYQRGAQLAQSCLGCHGEFGISTSDTIPNLKGQNKEYLEYALQTYKTRERKGGLSTLMYGHARGLSEQDIRDVTLYYSSQK